jgi:tetratricopeptide (TPR) repeat protein
MLGLLLLFGAAAWIGWGYLTDWRDDQRDRGRTSEKVRTRQMLLARMPDSAGAHEALGDALREAGRIEEAVACYRAALDLEANAPVDARGVAVGAGRGGTGLAAKLRLAEGEAGRGGQPAYGQTMATRQQVCRRCGQLNGPQDRACANCGEQMPVDHFLDTLRRDDVRRDLLRETADFLAKLAVIGIALYVASWMPIEIKGLLFISACAVLSWRFLRRIGGD